MLPDPAPDYPLVYLYANKSLLPFVLSTLRMTLTILKGSFFTFPLKTAVLARGLLKPAELQALLTSGQALLPAADADAESQEPAADEASNELLTDQDSSALWPLTLPDALTIATAADFTAASYLSSLGDEARIMQVEHNGMSAAAYDQQIHTTLGYLARFQVEWAEIFGEYAGYQARMNELAELRAEFLN